MPDTDALADRFSAAEDASESRPEPLPPAAEDDAPAQEAAADDAVELDALQITLDFVLGKARMPLGEVRALGAGAIVSLGSSLPASIAIFSAGRRLGSGEAVDVGGRLGIRITQWGAEA